MQVQTDCYSVPSLSNVSSDEQNINSLTVKSDEMQSVQFQQRQKRWAVYAQGIRSSQRSKYIKKKKKKFWQSSGNVSAVRILLKDSVGHDHTPLYLTALSNRSSLSNVLSVKIHLTVCSFTVFPTPGSQLFTTVVISRGSLTRGSVKN